MNLPSEIDAARFSPDGRTIDELAGQQEQLLALFEEWEFRFHSLKGNKKNSKLARDVRKSVEMMILIEKLWKESKRTSARLDGTPYEEISMTQYRMALFLERRKHYRHERENLAEVLGSVPDGIQASDLGKDAPEMEEQEKVVPSPQNGELIRKKKLEMLRSTQSALDSFLKDGT